MDLVSKQQNATSWLYYIAFILSIVAILLHTKRKLLKWKNTGSNKAARKYFGLRDIPGPRPVLGIEMIGNVPQLLPYSNVIPQLLKWSREYPDIAKGSTLNMTVVGLVSPEAIQQLLKSPDLGHGVKHPFYDFIKPFVKNGILVSKNKFWQIHRKILIKTQFPKNLKSYMGIFNRQSQRFATKLEQIFDDGCSHTIIELVDVFFLNILCELISGNGSIAPAETHRYQQNSRIFKKAMLFRATYPWFLLDCLWYVHPIAKRQRSATDKMFGFSRNLLKEYKETKLKTTSKQGSQSSEISSQSFLTVLDHFTDAGVDEDQIYDEVNNLLFAGHDTVAIVTNFFCLMMAHHPECQRLCQEEIDQLYNDSDGASDSQISFEAATTGLKYLERCIKETMRLYPPIVAFLRQLETSLVIKSGNIKYLLPEGTNIAVSPYIAHRNLKEFPNPEQFDPDRFFAEQVAQRHSFSYIPFSAGSRSCLAPKFAMISIKVAAAHILRKFDISSTTRIEDIQFLPFVTLTVEKDFEFQFLKRK